MDKATFLQKASAFKRIEVEIPDLGKVHVREVSAAEAKEYAKREQATGADPLDNAAWLASLVLCDEQGQQLLTGEEAASLKTMPLRVLKAIGEAAAKASGWDQQDDAKKNG